MMCLELNAETPAGLVESIGIAEIIKKELNIQHENPNVFMKVQIKAQFSKILEEYKRVKEIHTVAILCSTYYEDWYNAKAVYDIVEGLPYDMVMGNISDVQVQDEKIYLYGHPIDAVFRYYPLDWFLKEGRKDVLEALQLNTLSINPPHTIITQSKAFGYF